jgi:hypothetical protein
MMSTRFLFCKTALAAAGVLLCAGTVLAAGVSVDAQARYRQDLAACNSSPPGEDRTTCRLEARNALAEARRGGLNDAPGQYQQNALQRCGALKGDDRSDCEARMRGQGSIEGSVSGGGILRESVTTTPGQ